MIKLRGFAWFLTCLLKKQIKSKKNGQTNFVTMHTFELFEWFIIDKIFNDMFLYFIENSCDSCDG